MAAFLLGDRLGTSGGRRSGHAGAPPDDLVRGSEPPPRSIYCPARGAQYRTHRTTLGPTATFDRRRSGGLIGLLKGRDDAFILDGDTALGMWQEMIRQMTGGQD
jgi:hypothetical protein